jgi:hypothetical protein
VGGAVGILLDTCSILNLCATRRIDEILAAAEARFGVVDYVLRHEVLYLRRGGAGEDADERDPIDLQPFVQAGLIEVVTLQGEVEAARFVDFSVDLDDGEAITCAIATVRGHHVATDDRKTIRLLASRNPPVTVVRTSELIKPWSDKRMIAGGELRTILAAIRERANFEPAADDPLRSWWVRIVE